MITSFIGIVVGGSICYLVSGVRQYLGKDKWIGKIARFFKK